MAWTSGFFNSVNGDRRYNADQMSAIFDGIITNGVYESVGNKLVVEPNSGMTIQINTGRGWFNGRWVNNDTVYLQTLEAPDVLLNRYCAVCVRVDGSDGGRKAEPYLKYGELATTPIKPTMERSETVNEYCLAYVYIKGGASEIKAADIEDTRSNGELCGWVTGLIKQLDNNTLYKQWEAIFFDWFNNLEEYMDENVEAKLTNDVLQLKGRTLKVIATLEADKWTSANGVYTQTIPVNGVTAYNDILVSPIEADKSAYITMGCEVVSKDYHSITFECNSPSDTDVSVEVMIFNIDLLADVTVESVSNFSVTDDGNGQLTKEVTYEKIPVSRRIDCRHYEYIVYKRICTERCKACFLYQCRRKG
jgi:hypothetical protein